MKLIGTELGRYTIFFQAEEVRPIQGVQPPLLIKAIKEKYSFEYSPDLTRPWEAVQKEGYIFKLGKFSREGKDAGIAELGIYSDGIVINAFTTEDAEAFCNDLIGWGKKTFGYRDFSTPPRQAYASQITVHFGVSVNHLIGKVNEITNLFTGLVSKTYNLKVTFELQALGFDYDHQLVPRIYDLARFMIERRLNTKYEEGIFWSQAPLPTSVHIEVLEAFEKLISAPKASKQ